MIPLYRKLSSDDQDSVRLLTAQDLIAIAGILDHEETKSYLLPSIRSAVSDKSWRVRYMVADHFVEVNNFDIYKGGKEVQDWLITLLYLSSLHQQWAKRWFAMSWFRLLCNCSKTMRQKYEQLELVKYQVGSEQVFSLDCF